MTSANSLPITRFLFSLLVMAPMLTAVPAGGQESTPAEPAAATEAPAEEKPAEPAPMETAAPAAPTTNVDFAVPYARLVDPAIQSGLGLSEEQKTKIASLMSERRDAVAAADANARESILNASDDKLRAALTQTQLDSFVQMVQPKIRFNFKFTPWVDVLEWFADEAGLSLVIDAPPPGTFNYRDTREYTPTEAIDKMNSWLATKDYTLIRRDNMLMVMDISQELPKELIPRVTPEELKDRGRYELATTVFPLEGRPPEQVETEVKPLLGPHGTSAALTQTNQMLVTDQVKNLLAIQDLIKSIPLPKPPKKEEPKPPAPKPELRFYPAENFDAAAAVETLQKLVAGATYVVDPKALRINAYATPPEHDAILKVVDQIRADATAEKSAVLEVYPVQAEKAAETIAAVQLALPEVPVRHDSVEQQLVVFAKADQQAVVKTILEKLDVETDSGKGERQVEVYRLTNLERSTALALLEQILPRVKFTSDERQNAIVAVGTLEDHQMIRGVLDQLQAEADTPSNLRTYELKQPPSSTIVSTLQELAPGAKISLEGNRVVVIADDTLQSEIEAAIQKIDVPPSSQQTLKFYDIGELESATVLANLQPLLPSVRMSWDADTEQLIAFADSDDHAEIQKALDEWKTGVTDKGAKQLELIGLEEVDPNTTMQVLQGLFKQAKFMVDPARNGLIVIAGAEDLAGIKSVVAQLDQVEPEPEKQLQFYPVPEKLEANFLSLLQQMTPEASVTHEPENNRLVVIAKPKQQTQVKANIEKLLAGTESKEDKVLRSYTLTTTQKQRFQALVPTLQQDNPGIQVLPETVQGEISIWARPEQHEKLAGILDQIRDDVPLADKQQLLSYKLKIAEPNETIAVLQNLFPDTKFMVESRSRSILAWTRPAMQEAVKAAIEQIDSGKPGEFQQNFVILPLKNISFAVVQPMLQEAAPAARITHDPTANNIIIFADEETQNTLAAILEKMQQQTEAASDSEAKTTEIYPGARGRRAADLSGLMRQLVPNAMIEEDREAGTIIAVATAKDHEKLKEALTKYQAELDAQEKSEAARIPLKKVDANDVRRLLRDALPNVELESSDDGTAVMVIARPSEIAIVREIIEKLDAGQVDSEASLQVYSLKAIPGANAAQTLQLAYPQAKYTLSGADPYKIILWGTAEEQQQYAETLNQMDENWSAEAGGEMKVYHLDAVAAHIAQSIIQAAMPSVRFGASPDGKKMIVWANSEQHTEVQAMVDQLENQTDGKGSQLRIYTLEATGAAYAYPILANAVPGVVISYGQDPSKMMVWGTPSQLEKADKIIEEIKADGAPGKDAYVETYTFNKMPAANAIGILQMSFPQARITTTQDPRQLAIWARPNEHEGIGAVVQKLETSLAADDDRAIQVFPLNNIAHTTLLEFLDPDLKANANFTPNTATDSLIVQAPQDQMEALSAAIAELVEKLPRDEKPVSHVYRFQYSDPNAAAAVLRTLTPAANIAVDQRARSLVVTASPADHETIAGAIEEMDAEDATARAQILKHYKIDNVEVSSMMGMLQTLFAFQPEVRFSMDANTSTLVAYASESQHEEIAAFINDLDSVGAGQTSKAYVLENLDPSAAFGIVRAMFPRNPAVPDQATRSIVFVGSEADHKKMQEMIDSIDIDKGQVVQIYQFENGDPNSAISVLQPLAPQARYAVDQRTRSLMVTASAADQETIAAAVAKMDTGGSAKVMKHYKLDNVEVSSMQNMLQSLFAYEPEVRFSIDANTSTLVAYASEGQHAKIAEFIKELDAVGANQTSKAYPLKNLEPNAVFGIVRSMFPRNPAVPDQSTRSIVFVGSEADHERMAQMIESIDSAPSQSNQVVKSYTIENVEPNSLVNMLQSLYKFRPDIYFAIDQRNGIIMAHAPEEYQAKIASTIQEIDTQTGKSVSRAFSSSKVSSQALFDLLRTQFSRNQEITFSIDRQGGMVMAFAPQKKMDEIEEAVAAIEASAKEVVSKVYKLLEADARSAWQVLRTVVPDASISFDNQSNTILFAGSAEDQKLVEGLIRELEEQEATVVTSQVSKVYQSDKIEPNALVRMMRDMFPNSRGMSITENNETNSVIVYAKPSEHERIASAMTALEEGTAVATTEVYRLQYADPDSVEEALESVVPNAKLGVDDNNYSVVATANQKDHARIREAIERLDIDPNEGKQLEVFTLQVNEPYDAEYTIEQFFGNSVWDSNPASPQINSDEVNQQLLVRGTEKQLADIRQMLIKMGETHLAQATPSSNDSKIRVIPFHGNTEEAIEELQRVWPQLRSNKIKLVVPSAVAPTMRKLREPEGDAKPTPGANFSVEDDAKSEEKAEPSEQEREEFRKLVEQARAKLKAQAEAEAKQAEEQESLPELEPAPTDPDVTPQPATPLPAESAPATEEPEEPAAPMNPADVTPLPSTGEANETTPAEAPAGEAPPIIIAPGDDSITISSDDQEALNQIERLLRAMSREESRPSIGKDFVVFQLKYASAESVEDTLDDLFRGNRRRGGGNNRNTSSISNPFSSILVQADERLNALIVYGNKKERDMIEELLGILDTEETNDVLQQNKPQIVTVQNAPATRIESVLRDIYSSELRSAGGSRPIPIPAGVSYEVAATIQQINITRAAPLLTLTVDEDTNSIIIAGADHLVIQVIDLIHELDKKAETESTQTFKVVPLKKINSTRAREVLQELFPQNDFGGGRRGFRGRRNN
ncbi:MAG: hypothetical protein CMJ46_12700 [Planctomyces sp.]|nr:hypothetical protein [Planctomyces sp.]